MILELIAYWLIADGLISIYHFRKTATQLEQIFRVVRTGIGVYLLTI